MLMCMFVGSISTVNLWQCVYLRYQTFDLTKYELHLALGLGLWVHMGLPYCNSGPSHSGRSAITVRVPVL